MVDYYSMLGVKPGTPIENIEQVWVAHVCGWRPGIPQPAGYAATMAAGVALLELGQPNALNDWLPCLVALVESDVGGLRDTQDIEPQQIDSIAERLKLAPKTVSHSRLEGLPEIQSAQDLIGELLALEEFVVDRQLLFGTGDFDILWKPQGMTNKGCIIHASIQPIPQEQRDVWPSQPAPAYRLRINLPYWLLATADERERLIHHELAHADRSGGKIRTRPHDIEENLVTAGRYGARDLRHARLMEAALRHPGTQAMLRADPDGQLNFDLGGSMGISARGSLRLTKAG